MARYRGPRLKRCRRVGVVLPGLTTAATLDRPFPPGEHGTRRAGKPSDFKIRMMEKQKARWHFGILERQFKLYVKRASQLKGPSGLNLIMLLQSRLDAIVWRLGFARTIQAARQLVVHGHIQINGKRVDRPSYHVSAGDEISIKDKTKNKSFIQEVLAMSGTTTRPGWLEFDPAKATGKLIAAPDRSDLPIDVSENAIIEFYSQQL
jgi:small subunit ribosomal protein S4